MRYAAFIALILIAAEPPTEGIECGPEAVRQFSTKVHPILQNNCAACHSKAGAYSLVRQRDGATVANTQINLAASLKQIDRKNPAASPLLTKSIAAHGGAMAPAIKDANAPAYKNLELWVKQIAGEGTGKQSEPVVPKAVQVGASSEKTPPKDVVRDPFDPAIFNRMYRANP